MSLKTNVFDSVLTDFEDETMRAYCEDMIELMPDYHFEIPSSTTNKYHNATQCQPGGQSYHVLMVTTIMNYILGLEYMKQKYPKPKQRDCLRIAAILHDSQKTEGGQYTTHTHPLAAQKWIEETKVEHDISDQLKKYIGRLVASHSGSWTTSKRSSVVLPAPESDDQMLVHICDILGSRSNLDMIYSEEQKQAVRAFLKPVDPNEIIMPFGKHQGKPLKDIPRDYLEWAYNNMTLRDPLNTAVESILGV